jgi:hypothetical protein
MEADQYPQQPQMIPVPQAMPYMAPRDQYNSSIETLTNPDGQIDQMTLNFKNVEIDKEGNLKKCGEPLANDEGINFAIGQCRSTINQITVFSNLTNDNIYNVGSYLSINLLRTLMVSRIPFQMKSFSARSTIASTVLITSFITMKRAETEGLSDKKFWRGSVQELHSNITSNQAGKSKGWLGSLWK